MKMRIILLYAGQYQMVDERTGVMNSGLSCNYYLNTDLDVEDHTNGTKGMRPAKGVLDFDLMKKVKKAPAFYDADFEMTVDSKGHPILKIVDLDYVCPISIVPLEEDKQSKKEVIPAEPKTEKKAG